MKWQDFVLRSPIGDLAISEPDMPLISNKLLSNQIVISLVAGETANKLREVVVGSEGSLTAEGRTIALRTQSVEPLENGGVRVVYERIAPGVETR